MKKGVFLFALSIFCSMAFAQFQTGTQWNKVLSDRPETFQTQLISSSENSIKVNVQVPGFYTTSVTTPKGEAHVITVPKSVSTAQAGEPDMPMTGIPLMIGDKASMSVRVIDAQYMDFAGIEVAPSKGDFPRTIDPETVPYTYGKCYETDAFFPEKSLTMYEPYIIRDFRGQNMAVFPFAYNPVTKTLRVYYNMTVEMYKVDNRGENVIESRRGNEVKISADFKSVYQRHFLNYEESMAKYTALDEEGDLLIICYDNFISNMTDFVNWKKTRGINTTIVGTSTAGSSYSAIQTYIKNQYNANNNITHVLLVGDVAQIPGYTYSGGGSSYAGKGDNAYGQIVGSDYYNDVFIGRFSASTAARVTTQCNRVITYERDLTTSATWLQKAEGIAKKEGGSGHNGEDDYEHMDVIRTDLLNYGYSTVYQRYANLSGYTATAAQISADINGGVGIVNYCNHGAETMWGVASYSVSHVNALTNENMLPFIWSVACLVGKYDYSSDCFAEAWMNATNNNNPTGAIGTLMSYISQPWIPPMWAQDECVDILAGLSNSGGTKHTWGGVSINGLFGIFDNYGTDQSAVGTYQAWILYGDPSMLIRTKTPQAMTVSHTGTIAVSGGNYAVNVTNGNGAVATITDANHNILGKATVSNGSATINVSGTLTAGSELTLCVFGFDRVTYLGTISVVGGTKYDITTKVTPTNSGTVSGAGSYYENTQCTLTATPATGYTFTNWKKGNNVVSTDATYTFTVTSSTAGEYTATFTAIPQYTITASANPTNGGTVSGGGTFYENTSCTLTATANTGYAFSKWTKNGTQVSTNPAYTFTVTAAGAYVANFDQLVAHSVTCNTVEGGTIGANVNTAYMGDVVTLTATANDGYFFSVWDVRDANNNTIAVNNNQFTMPNADVTVNASFVQGCNVTIAEVEHGTVTASVTGAIPGTTITLTATPETDYSLSTWLVYQTGNVRNTVSVTGNSFVLPAFDVTVVGIFKMNKEAEVAIGSGNSADSYLPTYAYYKYSLTQQIYTASEVGQAGTITKIAFKVSNSKSTTRTLDVYLKHTTKTAFSSQTGWETVSSGDKVFSGSVAFQSSGWTTITLTTPFEYDGTSNLVVCVDDNTGSYVSSSNNSPKFYVYSTGANRALRIYSDGTNYTATSPSSYSGTYVTSNNQITFTMTVGGNDASLAVSPNAMEGFFYTQGEGPSAVKSFAVIGTDLTDNITLTAPDNFEISDAENGNYGVSLTLSSESKGSRDATTYDFEDGIQGWTLLKGSTGDSPNNWMHCTDYTPRDYTSGYGHSSSNGFVLSESYISGTESGTGTGVHPDNYLVSPQVTLGGSITFWASNPNDDYGSEHFALLVSTTNNTSINSFTQVEAWTLHAKAGRTGNTRTIVDGVWYEYTADLSAYSGTGYVAIRHFDCYDQWMLCIDDITIETPNTPVDPTDPTVDLLTANVYVRMKAGLSQGTYANETLTVATGDITSNVSLSGEVTQGQVTEQTITLAQGWNWFSSPLVADDLIDQVENNLQDNAKQITSKGYGFDQYNPNNSNWIGNLNSIAVENKYRIQTNNACQIAITGNNAIPAEHPITLNKGANWIGYPLATESTLNDALADFSPETGDRFESKNDGFAEYSGTKWIGTLAATGKTLKPGQGYIYRSKADDSKQLVYSASGKGDKGTVQVDEPSFWKADNTAFADIMCVTALVEIDGIASDDIELAAFVDGQCRGAVRMIYVESLKQHLAFLTVGGNDGETVSFKALANGNVVELEETERFSAAEALGSLNRPVVLHSTSGTFTLFPNPAERGEQVQVALPDSFDAENATVEVFNALGARVRTELLADDKSVSGLLAAGVYTLRISDQKGLVLFGKLVVR